MNATPVDPEDSRADETPLDESFEQQISDEKRDSLVKRLIAAGPEAPKVLLDSAVVANGRWAAKYLRTRDALDGPPDDLVQRVIKSHVRLARSEGAAVATAITAAEIGTTFGTAGTLTAPAAISGLVGDLAGLAWIQTRMVLAIAALHGHDPQEATRYRELLTLMGVHGAPQAESAAKVVGAGAGKAAERLVLRHLKGSNLQAVKSLFNMVGVKFTRVGLIKVIPFINVPVSALINGGATRALGRKADEYFRILPSPDELAGLRQP